MAVQLAFVILSLFVAVTSTTETCTMVDVTPATYAQVGLLYEDAETDCPGDIQIGDMTADTYEVCKARCRNVEDCVMVVMVASRYCTLWQNIFTDCTMSAGNIAVKEGEACSKPIYKKWELPNIVGGVDSTIEQYPWQVQLEMCAVNGCYMCGGSIISRRWVVTASHCTTGYTKADITVRVGSAHVSGAGGSTHSVSQVVDHPAYTVTSDSWMSDISLLQLSEPVDVNNARSRPIALPDAGDEFAGEECVISGWGATTEGGSGAEILQSANVTVPQNWDTCSEMAQSVNLTVVEDIHMCAGHHNMSGGVDTCQGDSGGPLACRGAAGDWTLAGVTSFGSGCGDPGTLGLYTRVSTFVDWIRDVTASEPVPEPETPGRNVTDCPASDNYDCGVVTTTYDKIFYHPTDNPTYVCYVDVTVVAPSRCSCQNCINFTMTDAADDCWQEGTCALTYVSTGYTATCLPLTPGSKSTKDVTREIGENCWCNVQ